MTPPKPPKGPVPPPRPPADEAPGHAQLQERLRAKREQRELEELDERLDEVESFRMPLIEHLVELKNRLIWAILAMVVGTAISFTYALEIFNFLTEPFILALSQSEGVQGSLSLITGPFEGVMTWLKVSVIGGLVLALPVVSWQVWSFVAPGLYKTEQKVVAPLAISSMFLFLLGAGFCYYGIFPYAFPFFIEVLGVDVNLSVEGYLSAVIRMMLAFGLCFQIPVVSWFLARAGLIDHRDMVYGFRYAMVVIFVLAAVITPPDPLTQTLLAVPMVLLYALGILIAKLSSTKVRVEGA